MTGNTSARLLLLVASSLVGLLLAEGAVRLFVDGPALERALLFSSPTLRLDEREAVRYIPNQEIRTVAVYDDTIEYDVVFRTNNLGFVDGRDYGSAGASAPVRYAFVGDSFTAGWHGGRPWVPELRNRVEREFPGRTIYNLGITGTGIQEFRAVLLSASRQLDFEHVVVLGLSDDFARSRWYPLADARGIRFCGEGITHEACMRKPYIAGIIERDAGTDEIDAAVRMIRSARRRNEWRRSRLVRYLRRSLKRQGDRVEPDPESWEALRAIRERFSGAEISFVHLPQKNEVRAGRYHLEPGAELRRVGFAYFPALQECEWNSRMFLPRDGHPNSEGYRAISDCVARYLFDLEPATVKDQL